MITNDELLETPEYWTTRIQLELYAHLQDYMKENGLNRTQLAQKLGVTKGYITQVLNGDFDHRLSKLVELSLSVGLIPKMEFVPKMDFFDERTKVASGFKQVTAAKTAITKLIFEKPYHLQMAQQPHYFYETSTNIFRFVS